jgi:3,4-dihydroxy-2-butanone 4-phosphate synthase
VAFQIKGMEVLVRITAKAKNAHEAAGLISPVDHEIRNRLGDVVFAADEVTVEQLVFDQLRARGWSVSTLERATQGRIGARLAITDPDGDVFAGAMVPGAGPGLPPRADVIVEVGPINTDRSQANTRPVDISVSTPTGGVSRQFAFGGDDETVREFAAVAGLHVLRLALGDG